MIRPKQVFRKHSTTYYYASRFLPKEKRERVEILYAFVRIPDEYVDNEVQHPKKYYEYKKDWSRENSNHPVVKSFKEVQKKTGIKNEWVESFFASMEMDLEKKTYKTQEDLNKYIYGSAEVIGLMMCQILTVSSTWHEEAKGLGWFMQYVNMLRDVEEDLNNGLIYIPQEKLREYNIENLEYCLDTKDKRLCTLIRKEATEALEKYDTIKKGIQAIPYPLRIAIQTAADMYVWTAKELIRDTETALETKKIPSKTKTILTGAKNIITC